MEVINVRNIWTIDSSVGLYLKVSQKNTVHSQIEK